MKIDSQLHSQNQQLTSDNDSFTSDTYLNRSLSGDSNISSIPNDDTDVNLSVSTHTLNLLDTSLCSKLSDFFDHNPGAQSS